MESINISFSANGQQLTGGGLYCASNTVHYIIADFKLGDGWQGFDSVRAVWSNDFKCISTVLDPDGSCTVPHEVLERRGKVSVNLVGSILEDDELTDRLTTYPILAITVDANAKICGTETAEVTPSQFEQFVQIVKDEVAKVKDIDRAELNADYTLTFYFSDGTETTVGPIRGEQGETGNGIESAVLNDDYTLTLTFTDGTEYTTPSIRGEQGEQGEPGEVTLAQLSSALPTDTASGAIASFEDGSDLFDYLSCIVDITPLQDLHGYDKPWVGGAGKNLYSDVFSEYTKPGAYYLKPINLSIGDTISVSVTLKSTTVSGCAVGIVSRGDSYPFEAQRNFINTSGQIINQGAFTLTDSWTDPKLAIYCSGEEQFNQLFANYHIQLEKGSTTTSYEPYENLCPITGWTGCEVSVAGVNLFDKTAVSVGKWLSTTTGLEESASGYVVSDYIKVEANKPVFIPKSGTARRWLYDENKTPLTYLNNSSDQTYTPPVNGYIRITILTSGGGAVDINGYQVEYGSTASDYHAYNGTTYSVSWQTEAGTVYGGTVDVVSGVLTVDRASVDLGTLTPYQKESGVFGLHISCPTSGAILCSAYPVGIGSGGSLNPSNIEDKTIITTNFVGTYYPVFVKDTDYTSAADFKTAMNGVQLVYELATPTTYQLDPVQVACLLGQNNVWADCGDIEEVKYKADVQLWVEKKLGE